MLSYFKMNVLIISKMEFLIGLFVFVFMCCPFITLAYFHIEVFSFSFFLFCKECLSSEEATVCVSCCFP